MVAVDWRTIIGKAVDGGGGDSLLFSHRRSLTIADHTERRFASLLRASSHMAPTSPIFMSRLRVRSVLAYRKNTRNRRIG